MMSLLKAPGRALRSTRDFCDQLLDALGSDPKPPPQRRRLTDELDHLSRGEDR